MINFYYLFLSLIPGVILWFITFTSILIIAIKKKIIEIPFTVTAGLISWTLSFLFNTPNTYILIDKLLYVLLIPITLLVYYTYKYGYKQINQKIDPLKFRIVYSILVIGLIFLFKIWIENDILRFESQYSYFNSGVKTLLIINLLYSLSSLNQVLKSYYFNSFSKQIAILKLISALTLNIAFITFLKADLFTIVISSLIFLTDLLYLQLIYKNLNLKNLKSSDVKFFYNPIFEKEWIKEKKYININNDNYRYIDSNKWIYKSEISNVISRKICIEGNIILQNIHGDLNLKDIKPDLDNSEKIIHDLNLHNNQFYFISNTTYLKVKEYGEFKAVKKFHEKYNQNFKLFYLVNKPIFLIGYFIGKFFLIRTFRHWHLAKSQNLAFKGILNDIVYENPITENLSPSEKDKINLLDSFMKVLSKNEFEVVTGYKIPERDPYYKVFETLKILATEKKTLVKEYQIKLDTINNQLNTKNETISAITKFSDVGIAILNKQGFVKDYNQKIKNHFNKIGLQNFKEFSISKINTISEFDFSFIKNEIEVNNKFTQIYKIDIEKQDYYYFKFSFFIIGDENYGLILTDITKEINLQNSLNRNIYQLKSNNQHFTEITNNISHKLNHHTASLKQLLGNENDIIDVKKLRKLTSFLAEDLKTLNNLVFTKEVETITSAADQENFQNSEINTILLVDDDILTNSINKIVITKSDPNIKITTAKNGKKAIELITEKGFIPDLIFLDVNMPEMNGWAFLDAITDLNIDIPVIMLTSTQNPDEINKALSYSMVKDFISKPLTIKHVQKLKQL